MRHWILWWFTSVIAKIPISFARCAFTGTHSIIRSLWRTLAIRELCSISQTRNTAICGVACATLMGADYTYLLTFTLTFVVIFKVVRFANAIFLYIQCMLRHCYKICKPFCIMRKSLLLCYCRINLYKGKNSYSLNNPGVLSHWYHMKYKTLHCLRMRNMS
jgi:hypothetical protein